MKIGQLFRAPLYVPCFLLHKQYRRVLPDVIRAQVCWVLYNNKEFFRAFSHLDVLVHTGGESWHVPVVLNNERKVLTITHIIFSSNLFI